MDSQARTATTTQTDARIILTPVGLWFTRIRRAIHIVVDSIDYVDGAGTCSELMPLLVQEPIRGDREVEDRTSWKPEVPFMAGSVEDPVRETSHTAHTHCYVQATGSL